MAVFSSKAVDVKNFPPDNKEAGAENAVRAEIVFSSAVTLAQNDVLRFMRLPRGFVVTSIELDNDALGTASVASVGILNDAETAVDKAAITGANTASAGIKVDNAFAARRAGAFDVEKTIGAVITTAASAALAPGAKVGVTVRFRRKQNIEPAAV